ncbi:MAG: hypothetical protein HY744_00385 [Deltaproteobacteria bacterium]|nr:hypothetical protein [Deltaproteobacteria bacterium]
MMRAWRRVLSSSVLAAGLLLGPAVRGLAQTPASSAASTEAAPGARARREQPKPPPVHVDYLSYGLAISADVLVASGATCRESPGDEVPCILGSGGGLVLRGGYRSAGPWYVGGAYQFSKTDSSNLYRLGILQQLRAEMRYVLDLGYRVAPYATWGLGGVVYGNEFGVETGGAGVCGGLGVERQRSRLTLLGLAASYQPTLLAGWTDTAGFERDPGLAQYLRLELQLELRSEHHRR